MANLTDTFTVATDTALTAHTSDSGSGYTQHASATGTATVDGPTDAVHRDTFATDYTTPWVVMHTADDTAGDGDGTLTVVADWPNDNDGFQFGAWINPSAETGLIVEVSNSGWFATGAGPRIRLRQIVSGTITALGQWDMAALSLPQSLTIALTRSGTDVTVNVDGTDRITATTTLTGTGSVGIDPRARSAAVGPQITSVDWVLSGGDTTAPTLSSPSASATGTTTGSGSVSTDEDNGTLYFVVSTNGSAPSAAQVAAGNDSTGSAGVDSGSQSVSGTGTQNISGGFTGLSPDTLYYVYYMHEDSSSNQSSVVSTSFTTDEDTGAIIIPLHRRKPLIAM